MELGAESAFDRFLAALDDLAGVQAHAFPPLLDLPRLSSTPLAWADARTDQIGQVQEALRRHSDAQLTE